MMKKSVQQLLSFGILNIDKPAGPTSFQVSNYIKKLSRVSKTSHFGTLDPQVTGVLPVALGRACRLSNYFMHSDKEYVGIMRLHSDVVDKKLNEEINNFIGKILQLPPVRSRVKRTERVREIKKFEILEREGKDVLFKTDVQAGTYVRKLIHDIGENIGGAHMLELRRTRASVFSSNDSSFSNLYKLTEAFEECRKGNENPLREILIPAEIVLQKVMPVAKIKEKNLSQILTGKFLKKEDFLSIIPDEELFAAFCNGKFIGVYGKKIEGGIIAKPEFVFN